MTADRESCCFPGAVVARQAKNFSLIGIKGYIIDRDQIVETPGQVLDMQCDRHKIISCFSPLGERFRTSAMFF
ncbi:MAG: hypothetical protein ABFC71_04410 [Methanoregula sp.]